MISTLRRRSQTLGSRVQICIKATSLFDAVVPNLFILANCCHCACLLKLSQAGRQQALAGKRAWQKHLKRMLLALGELLANNSFKTMFSNRLGKRVGRLDDADMLRLNRVMVVFLGLAGSSK